MGVILGEKKITNIRVELDSAVYSNDIRQDTCTPSSEQCVSSFKEFELLEKDSVWKLVLGTSTKYCPL